MAITCMNCETVLMETRRLDERSLCGLCAGLASRWKVVKWIGEAEGVIVRHECGYSLRLDSIEVLAQVIVDCAHCGKTGIIDHPRVAGGEGRAP